ncbi:MAG: hypothetical protein VX527_08680 [Planctomycetota bacterium]|nr:hypothetical protein [Planctomycetota bacterium]
MKKHINPIRFVEQCIACFVVIFLLGGCQATSPGEYFSIKPAWNHQVPGLTHFSLANGVNIWVQQSPIVTLADVKTARYITDADQRPAVMVEFDAAGTARISRFTSGHDNQPLAVFVDGLLISAPLVNGEVGDEFMVMGLGDKAQAEQFLANCKAQAAKAH